MKALFSILVLTTLALFATAHANDCASNTQMGVNECTDAAYKKTDAELNRVYRQIGERLKKDKDTSLLLVSAQKRWVSFRDAECAFSSSAGAEGSIYPLLVTQCRDALTSKRIEQLKIYLHCREGDISCPVPAE